MSKSAECASQLSIDISIGEEGVYVVIIDTDSYAGNFEREMAAFAAGAYDADRYHGANEFAMFNKESDADKTGMLHGIAVKITYVHHSEYDFVSNTIWPTPGILDDGSGKIVKDDGIANGWPAYNSVAIFFEVAPTNDELNLIKERAIRYGATRTNWNNEPDPINVTGIRCLHFYVNEDRAPVSSPVHLATVEHNVTIYGLTADLGDGSCTIRWFRDSELVQQLLDDDTHCEEFWGNEGSPNSTLTFPATLDLEKCGFRFSDKSYQKG